MDVKDRSVVVTGAARGIGAAIAEALLVRGARVALSDLPGTTLGETADRLGLEHGDRVVAVPADVASRQDLERLCETTTEAHGPIDMFFANAGVPGTRELGGSDDEWLAALDVNVLAHVRAAQVLVPQWLERGEGYFVSTASAAGLLTQIGSATYSVTKHAAVAFAEWLAVTYGTRGIRVSCLCPMGVDTAMLDSGRHSDDELERKMVRAVTEAGSVLAPAQVAAEVMACVEDERFLVLPHPEVLEMYRRKGSDYDRWISGMQRYADSLS